MATLASFRECEGGRLGTGGGGTLWVWWRGSMERERGKVGGGGGVGLGEERRDTGTMGGAHWLCWEWEEEVQYRMGWGGRCRQRRSQVKSVNVVIAEGVCSAFRPSVARTHIPQLVKLGVWLDVFGIYWLILYTFFFNWCATSPRWSTKKRRGICRDNRGGGGEVRVAWRSSRQGGGRRVSECRRFRHTLPTTQQPSCNIEVRKGVVGDY